MTQERLKDSASLRRSARTLVKPTKASTSKAKSVASHGSYRKKDKLDIAIGNAALRDWYSGPFIELDIDENTEEEYKPLLFEGEESIPDEEDE